MARETKAERQAREALVRQAMLEEQAATYPQRLMALMQRAQAVNFELTANSDCTFTLYDRDDRHYSKFELDYFYSEASDDDLRDLTWRVECKEEEERERNRQYQVKQAALAKLSQEEKDLLGL